MAKTLEDALVKPDNIGERIDGAIAAYAVPPIIPREQAGLAVGSLGPAPSIWTTEYDRVRQWHRPGTSQNRFPPLPAKANPQVGAIAQSAAAAAVAAIPPSTGGGGATTVSLDIPNIFTPITQTVTLPGPLTFDLATEPAGSYFGVPGGAGLSGLEGFNIATGATGGGGSGTVTATATPSTATSWGLYPVVTKNGYAAPSGWTGLTGNDGLKGAFIKSLTGTTPVSISQTLAANDTATGSLIIFSGALPSIVQQASKNSFSGQSMALAYGSNNTAGNTLFIVFNYLGGGSVFGMSAADSAGNSYTTMIYQLGGNTTIGTSGQLVMVATGCSGAANTVTVTVTGGGGGSPAGLLQIFEIAPIPSGPGVPFFHPLFPSDIPPINLNSTGNGGIANILGLGHGGTKSDLLSTGGTSQVLQQSSAGAAITVGQLAASDLSNGTTGSGSVVLAGSPTLTGTVALPIVTLSGKVTNYNGIATVSDGVPAEYATVDLTAQSADVGATTLYAVPASGIGMYRVSAYVVETTAASVSSTLPNVQIVYTDPDTNTSITIDATPILGIAGIGQTGALTTNTIGTISSGVIVISAKASTNIQYQTVNYASSAAGMQFALHIKLEAL